MKISFRRVVSGIVPFCAVCIQLFSSRPAGAQPCTKHFEVNAGPDIEVCSGGSVGLGGSIGGDANTATWRGGTGTFSPDRNTVDAEYTASVSEHGTTVVLILVAKNPAFADCLPERDQMSITVNEEVKVNAGGDQQVCGNQPVKLHGTVSGKAKLITWITRGSGSFDNPHNAEAVYTPSDADVKSGAVTIYLKAQPFGVCLPDSDAIILTMDGSFLFTTETDLNTIGSKPVNLVIHTSGTPGSIRWTSEGSGKFNDASAAQTNYNPSGEDVKNGKIVLLVTTTSVTGKCSAEKAVTLHLLPRAAVVPEEK